MTNGTVFDLLHIGVVRNSEDLDHTEIVRKAFTSQIENDYFEYTKKSSLPVRLKNAMLCKSFLLLKVVLVRFLLFLWGCGDFSARP